VPRSGVMPQGLYASPGGPEQPSPWWLKGGAIFIGVLGVSSLIGAISLAASGFWLGQMLDELDPEEACSDDPDPACEEVIRSLTDMAEMSMWDVGAAASGLLFLLSIPTAILMWNAEDRDTALKLAWGWVVLHAGSQLYITYSYMEWLDDFYESIPEDLGWVSLFSSVASYGSVLMCELTLAAGLALISHQTKPPTAIEIPSGFHQTDSPET